MSISDLQQIKNIFKGNFLLEPAALQEKLFKIKAYVFDWDGVFNNGEKDENGSSRFNEVDSMGLNMLRFNHYLRRGVHPLTGIITGETNNAAFILAKREHFHAVYYNTKNKRDALLHFCAGNNLELHEVAYFFDDVTDLSIAELCGLRIMVSRRCNPMLLNLSIENKWVDYLTYADGGNNALREASELLIGLSERYSDTILQRVHNSDGYQVFIRARNIPATAFYTLVESKITEQHPR